MRLAAIIAIDRRIKGEAYSYLLIIRVDECSNMFFAAIMEE